MGKSGESLRASERGMSLVEVMVATAVAAGFALTLAQMMNNSSRGVHGVQLSADFTDLTTQLSQVLNNQGSCQAFMGGMSFNPAATDAAHAPEICGVYGNTRWRPRPPSGASPPCPTGGAGAADAGMDIVHMQLVSLSPAPAGTITSATGLLNTYLATIHVEVNRNRRVLASSAFSTTGTPSSQVATGPGASLGSPTMTRDLPVTVALTAPPGTAGAVSTCYGQLSSVAFQNQICSMLGGSFSVADGPSATPVCSSLQLTGNTTINHGDLTINQTDRQGNNVTQNSTHITSTAVDTQQINLTGDLNFGSSSRVCTADAGGVVHCVNANQIGKSFITVAYSFCDNVDPNDPFGGNQYGQFGTGYSGLRSCPSTYPNEIFRAEKVMVSKDSCSQARKTVQITCSN